MFLSFQKPLQSLQLFVSAVFFLCYIGNSHLVSAQHPSIAEKGLDSVEVVRERSLIPGETMGQKMESLLFWSQEEKKRRFPHMQDIFPSIEVPAGDKIYRLTSGESLSKNLPPDFLSQYIRENQVGGVIVLKDNKIRLEAYGEGVNQHSVWTSFSVAKSVTSMLLGVALKEGDVESLEDPLSKYIPELKGRDYGMVTVRELLTMTSGIDWNEDYADARSDVAQMYQRPCEGVEPHILSYMKPLKSIYQPGTKWNYSTGETDLLGILVQKATGKSLAEYLSEKIWKPWGMEDTAYWLADECSLLNLGGSGLSATLRDYARLGTVMLKEGTGGPSHLFADQWAHNATSLLFPTGDDGGGYGYLWWRFPNGSFAAFGIFGQMIYINPHTQVVIAQFAAWPQAGSKELSAKRMAFIQIVEEELQRMGKE